MGEEDGDAEDGDAWLCLDGDAVGEEDSAFEAFALVGEEVVDEAM